MFFLKNITTFILVHSFINNLLIIKLNKERNKLSAFTIGDERKKEKESRFELRCSFLIGREERGREWLMTKLFLGARK